MTYEEEHADFLERMKTDEDGGTPCLDSPAFREIGFITAMWLGGWQENIYFIQAPAGSKNRMDKVSRDAVHEFVEYWENQINVAKDYLANNCNPNVHEWKTKQNS